MAWIKPKVNKVRLYETMKTNVLLWRDNGDGIIDWGGTLGIIAEGIDGKLIEEAFAPVIEKLDELIEQAKAEESG